MLSRRHLLGAVPALSLLPAASLRAQAQAPALTICFVHVGPVTDNGWTYRHDLGRIAVEQAHGPRIQTRTVESVGPGPDSERVMEALIAEGAGMIINTGSDHQSAVHKIARRHPEVLFEHVGGTERAENVATYMGRFYEGRYVHGLAAGRLTRTGIAGFVGSFPIAEVFQAINAFTLGFRQTRPEAETRIVWVNTWYDPAKEAEAARALIDQGADVLLYHTDSPATVEAAEAAGIRACGLSNDMAPFAPTAVIGSILKNWGPYYVERVGQALAGTWKSGDFFGGLNTRMTDLTPWNGNIPAEALTEAEAARQAIIAGTRHPFAGPIRRQDGSIAAAEGATLSDAELLQMNWYVEGVRGTPPG